MNSLLFYTFVSLFSTYHIIGHFTFLSSLLPVLIRSLSFAPFCRAIFSRGDLDLWCNSFLFFFSHCIPFFSSYFTLSLSLTALAFACSVSCLPTLYPCLWDLILVIVPPILLLYQLVFPISLFLLAFVHRLGYLYFTVYEGLGHCQ